MDEQNVRLSWHDFPSFGGRCDLTTIENLRVLLTEEEPEIGKFAYERCAGKYARFE
jgi:hypothetical protein